MPIPAQLPHQKRIVIVGAGFAGLALAKKINLKEYQVVLIDRHNYHTFQPLFYQVATAGLEPSSISFPLRKIFQSRKNFFLRVAEVEKVDTINKSLHTNIGEISYDFLVIATGAYTNYFGNKNLQENSYSMKSIPEALQIRNTIIRNLEKALITTDEEERKALMTVVIAGAGPTGVELAGTLADMRHKILPKDYPELDFANMSIHLIEGSPRVLNAMQEESGKRAHRYLEKLGVKVKTATVVADYDGKTVTLKSGETIVSHCVIWAAGVKAQVFEGLPENALAKNGRVVVDAYNQVQGLNQVYAIGDVALQTEEKYPNGHPMVAPVGMQQAANLGRNFNAIARGKEWEKFSYFDKGSMATVGKNLAVVEIGKFKFGGLFAWLTWMFVHLMSIVGVKNRLMILINWVWGYITNNPSLRLIIEAGKKK